MCRKRPKATNKVDKTGNELQNYIQKKTRKKQKKLYETPACEMLEIIIGFFHFSFYLEKLDSSVKFEFSKIFKR